MTEFMKVPSSLEKAHTWLLQSRDNESETQEKILFLYFLYILFYFLSFRA